jgi:hypothetical protein
MPSGKPGAIAGAVSVERLSQNISIRSMRRHAKKGHVAITVTELKQLRRKLRDAFTIYRIDMGRTQVTPTEQRRLLAKIVVAAKHFERASTWAWADKLLSHLEAERSIETIARRASGLASRDWLTMKKDLRSMSASAPPSDDLAVLVAGLSEIDIDAVVPTGAKWRDPGLVRLVLALAPIWRRVTGRSDKLVSVDRSNDEKRNFFAEWLNQAQRAIGVQETPVRQINDVLRSQK